MLYAGLYSSVEASYQILRSIEQGSVRPVLSTTLVFEFDDVLKRDADTLGLDEQDVEAVLDDLCRVGDHQVIYFLWRPFLSDAKDDHILELAVASGTQTIVTHNVKDFGGSAKFGIRAITPGQLLRELK